MLTGSRERRQVQGLNDMQAVADLRDRATAMRAAAATVTSQIYFASGTFGLMTLHLVEAGGRFHSSSMGKPEVNFPPVRAIASTS